jgi:hypothetical protein
VADTQAHRLRNGFGGQLLAGPAAIDIGAVERPICREPPASRDGSR